MAIFRSERIDMINVSKTRKRSRLTFVIAVCVVSFLMSCADKGIEYEDLKPVQKVAAVNDTVTLSSHVSNLVYREGRYYISDYHRGIVSFDESFSAMERMDGGTLQLAMPQCYMFAVGKDGSMCVYNHDEKTFCLYNGKNIEKISVPDYCVTYPSRFSYEGDSIIFPVVKNANTAVVMLKDSTISRFSPVVKGLDDARMPYHSDRMIVKNDIYTFVIGRGIPLVQMYSHDFKLVSSYDLRAVEDVAETVEQQKSDDPNTYFVVLRDVYCSNDKLYVLVSTKKDGKYKSNLILVLNIENDAMALSSAYVLEGNVYSTLCVNEKGQLVVVNSKTSNVEFYEIAK